MSNLGKSEDTNSKPEYYQVVFGVKPQIFSDSKIVLNDAPINREVFAKNAAGANSVKLAVSQENLDQNGIKLSPVQSVASGGRFNDLNGPA